MKINKERKKVNMIPSQAILGEVDWYGGLAEVSGKVAYAAQVFFRWLYFILFHFIWSVCIRILQFIHQSLSTKRVKTRRNDMSIY